jgi:argininosuccinate lyase
MLAKIGVLTRNEFQRLKRELKNVIALDQAGKFVLTVEDEDVHTRIENHLTGKLGALGEKIHAARSRNDQVLADLRFYTKEQLLAIEGALLELGGALLAFAREHEATPMPGYTHLQRAMPSSVATWAASFTEALLDDLVVLKAAYELNDQCPLGSAAGYGVPLAVDRGFTSKLLGFSKVQNNVLYVQSSRGKISAAVIAALSQVMLDLARMANDLIVFSTAEFSFFSLPREMCTGSSIMPQKKNPDVLELIRARASIVQANLMQVIQITQSLGSGYYRDYQETKAPLLESLGVTKECLEIFVPLIRGLGVNEERLLGAFTPEIFAADAALELVEKGVPFRSAYRRVAENLGALKSRDAKESMLKKKHAGAPGNLGLEKIGRIIAMENSGLMKEEDSFNRRIAALLK